MAEYHRLKADTVPTQQAAGPVVYPPRSVGALVLEYQAAPEWKDLRPTSKRVYGYVLDWLPPSTGPTRSPHRRRHVKRWRDASSETPGMANMTVSVVRTLMTFAIDSDYRKDNPALRIKLFKLGEHRAWTEEELAAFERRWAPGTMQRRAYALARYTGQRCGDVAAMTRAHRKDGDIRVMQQKTGAELWVREHRELAAELTRGEQGHMALLTKSEGGVYGDELGPGLPTPSRPLGCRTTACCTGCARWRRAISPRPGAASTRSCPSPATSRWRRCSATPGRRVSDGWPSWRC